MLTAIFGRKRVRLDWLVQGELLLSEPASIFFKRLATTSTMSSEQHQDDTLRSTPYKSGEEAREVPGAVAPQETRGDAQPAADYFDRQRNVPDWNDDIIKAQRALVLGVGGIGCTIAMALCRLGIQQIVLVDRDVVEASNLNRQVLFCKADVGRPKVHAGFDGLQHHNIRSEIIPLQIDAVEQWQTVVEHAKTATVVFNCIDHGQYFDFAVSALCVRLNIPYSAAASYGHTALLEFYGRKGGKSCWACNNEPPNREVLLKLQPEYILEYKSLDVIAEHRDPLPPTRSVGSSILPCSLASQMAVAAWMNTLFGAPIPNWAFFNLYELSLASFPVDQNPNCLLCSWDKPKKTLTETQTDTAASAVTAEATSPTSEKEHAVANAETDKRDQFGGAAASTVIASSAE